MNELYSIGSELQQLESIYSPVAPLSYRIALTTTI
jgi:hypothetical protein